MEIQSIKEGQSVALRTKPPNCGSLLPLNLLLIFLSPLHVFLYGHGLCLFVFNRLPVVNSPKYAQKLQLVAPLR